MYKVRTETDTYAVKWLNPSIMERNNVIENMIHSEKIAGELSKHLPVVSAITIEGSQLLELNTRYYMVYSWVDGTSVFPPSISEMNCFEIGSALGKIHSLNISIPEIQQSEGDTVLYRWQELYEKGLDQKASWIDTYRDNIERLFMWTQKTNHANLVLSQYMVISHRDLDPKNVMWNHDSIYLIDWEAAGYVNPYQELLEVLNYWSDNGAGELDDKKFITLLHAYSKYMNTKDVDWYTVLDSGYGGMLGWLEYSLKRALGMESEDEQEIKLGAEQIVSTIDALLKFDKQRDKMMQLIRQ